MGATKQKMLEEMEKCCSECGEEFETVEEAKACAKKDIEEPWRIWSELDGS